MAPRHPARSRAPGRVHRRSAGDALMRSPLLKAAGGAMALAGAAWMGACASLYWRAFRPVRWGGDGDHGWTPADLGVPHESLETRTRGGPPLLARDLPRGRDAARVGRGGPRGPGGGGPRGS